MKPFFNWDELMIMDLKLSSTLIKFLYFLSDKIKTLSVIDNDFAIHLAGIICPPVPPVAIKYVVINKRCCKIDPSL